MAASPETERRWPVSLADALSYAVVEQTIGGTAEAHLRMTGEGKAIATKTGAIRGPPRPEAETGPGGTGREFPMREWFSWNPWTAET